jgi:hypothetical protein
LVAALQSPKERVPAAVAILNRGWGLPVQPVEGEGAQSITFMHLIAARACSDRMAAERVAGNAGTTIDAEAEPQPLTIADLTEPALE